MNRLNALLVMLVAVLVAGRPDGSLAGPRPTLKLAVSIYAGWMPHYFAKDVGLYKTWGDRYGLDIEVVEMDYIPSIEAYVAQQVDAVVITNMEALDMPAKGGVDTTVVLVGDYSNGNDAILTRNIPTVEGLKGHPVMLVELSVSHYLLARALETGGLLESAIKLVNTSDADIAPAFLADKKAPAVVTWNPMVLKVEQSPGVKRIFDSAKIPEEILDLLVVNTKTLEAHPEFAEALVGVWYDVMRTMQTPGLEADKALEQMAKRSGCTLAEYKAQLRTTAMYWTPQAAVEFTKSARLKQKMDFVRNFCFKHGLLGEDAKSVDVVGVSYPDGSVQGSGSNIKLRFSTAFMDKAAAGELKTGEPKK
jgi:NitT/TauT family transport system substrate-binding protein